MAVVADIAATWRAPGAVFDRMIREGQGDDVVLIHAIIGGVLHFVAAAPAQARAAFLEPSVPVEARLFWSALLFILLLPILLWSFAMVVGGLGSLLGAPNLGRRLRLGLFWGFVAGSPLALLMGMTAGFIGPGTQTSLTAALWGASVAWFFAKGALSPAWRAAP